MWISSAQWNELQERLNRLEGRPGWASYLDKLPPEKIVYYPNDYISSYTRKEVEVQTVVMRILSHLGLRLDYDFGVEPHTKLVPVPAPAIANKAKRKGKKDE